MPWLRSKIEDILANIVAWAIIAFGAGAILAIWALLQSVPTPVVIAVFLAGSAGTFDAVTAFNRARAGSNLRNPSGQRAQSETVFVMHEGIRWTWSGGYHYGSGRPIGRAECPEHHVALLYRDNAEDSYREPYDSDIVDEARDQWLECPYEKWSPDQGGHLFFFPSSETKMGTALLKAELLLQAKLPEDGRM